MNAQTVFESITPEQYRDALEGIRLRMDEAAVLKAQHADPHHELSALGVGQVVKAGYGRGNLVYGGLGKRVGYFLKDVHNIPLQTDGKRTFWFQYLATGYWFRGPHAPGDGYVFVMRPALAEALEGLGIVKSR